MTALTNFMIEHAFQAAQNVLEDRVHFHLSPEEWDEFVAALDAPPRVIPEVQKLLRELSVFDKPE